MFDVFENLIVLFREKNLNFADLLPLWNLTLSKWIIICRKFPYIFVFRSGVLLGQCSVCSFWWLGLGQSMIEPFSLFAQYWGVRLINTVLWLFSALYIAHFNKAPDNFFQVNPLWYKGNVFPCFPEIMIEILGKSALNNTWVASKSCFGFSYLIPNAIYWSVWKI